MKAFSFEIRDNDLAGRIGKLMVGKKTVETPAIMPVVNPRRQSVSVKELSKKFGSQFLMTNAYILLKNPQLREKVEEQGIHKFLGFDGVVATDSGSFQLMAYGAVDTNNRDIIRFQNKIGSDIGSFLDIPTLPDTWKPRAEEQLNETIARAEEAEKAKFVVNAGIQGGRFLDLRAQAAAAMAEVSPLVAVGGIVPLMESYRFGELVDIIAAVKQNIPSDRVVHAFGLGHPMAFSLAVALGCDLFDSAAYALYAEAGRYLTEYGTKRIGELEYLPCTCPVCKKFGLGLKELPEKKRVRELARHNLYVTFAEIDRVKQAIKEGSLWELVCTRARSHPDLLSGLEALTKHSRWVSGLDRISKRCALYCTGFEDSVRPEVVNAGERLKSVKSENLYPLYPFGEVPAELLDLYPFGQTIQSDKNKPEDAPPKIRDLAKIRAIAEYQFGEGAGELIAENAVIKRSRATKRIRGIYEGNELYASVRASDHFILPKEKLAKKLLKKFKKPRLRVVLEDDAEVVECVREGKSVFAKFVEEVDPELRAGDECLVVDKKDNLVRVGTLALAPQEVLDFSRGMAVRVR